METMEMESNTGLQWAGWSPNTQRSVTHKLTSAKALPPYTVQLYYLNKYKFKECKSASPNVQRYSQVLEIFRILEIKGVAKSSFG